jgi:hypothetical protein
VQLPVCHPGAAAAAAQAPAAAAAAAGVAAVQVMLTCQQWLDLEGLRWLLGAQGRQRAPAASQVGFCPRL